MLLTGVFLTPLAHVLAWPLPTEVSIQSTDHALLQKVHHTRFSNYSINPLASQEANGERDAFFIPGEHDVISKPEDNSMMAEVNFRLTSIGNSWKADLGTNASENTVLGRDDLEGTLCPVVVHGSVRSRFLQYMKSTLDGELANTGLQKIKELCEDTNMRDGQRLRELQIYLYEVRNQTLPSWTDHAHPDKGSSTAKLLEKLLPGPPTAVLDYGSGDGTDLAAVAAHFDLSHDKAVGIDVDPDSMLPENKEKVTFWHLEKPLNTSLTHLESEYLGEISVAWAFGVLHHIPEDNLLKQTLKSLAGTLTPGGTLAIQEWALPATGSGRDVAVFYDWVHLLNGAFFFPPRQAKESKSSEKHSQSRVIHGIGTKYRRLADWHSLMAGAGLDFSTEKSRLGSGGMEPDDEASHSVTGGFLAVYLKPEGS